MRELNKQEQEKFKYLMQKNNHRDQLVTDVKEALKEDIEQKKEISSLKRMDQQENFQRG